MIPSVTYCDTSVRVNALALCATAHGIESGAGIDFEDGTRGAGGSDAMRGYADTKPSTVVGTASATFGDYREQKLGKKQAGK